jgi:hypothetical protein
VQRKGTFLAHNHGANAMLQLRSVEEFYSDPISGRLYEVIYSHLVITVKYEQLLPVEG